MLKSIRRFCLKLIPKKSKSKKSDFYNEKSDFFNEFNPTIDELKELAGINSSPPPAQSELEEALIQKEYKRLKLNPITYKNLCRRAEIKAESRIVQEETAQLYASSMAENRRRMEEREAELVSKWLKHLTEKECEDPEPCDFAEFLIKNKYLTKDELERMTISAIFIGGKMINYPDFDLEMKRVKSEEFAPN